MPRYSFVQWQDELGNVIGTDPTLSIFVGADMTITAVYEEIVVPTHTLTVSATVGGTTSPAPGSYIFDEGVVVAVTAIPDAGYELDHWELDGVDVGKVSPYDVLMDADHTLHAVFAPTVDKATITGAVTDAETGNPIVDANVVADGYSTKTGSDGSYSLTVDLAVYTLTVGKAGYETQSRTVDASIEGTYTENFALISVPIPPIPLGPIIHVVGSTSIGLVLLLLAPKS